DFSRAGTLLGLADAMHEASLMPHASWPSTFGSIPCTARGGSAASSTRSPGAPPSISESPPVTSPSKLGDETQSTSYWRGNAGPDVPRATSDSQPCSSPFGLQDETHSTSDC